MSTKEQDYAEYKELCISKGVEYLSMWDLDNPLDGSGNNNDPEGNWYAHWYQLKYELEFEERLKLWGNVTEPKIKKELLEAIESAKDYDWCWNGEDEVRVDTFDSQLALRRVLEVINKHYSPIIQ